MTSVDFAGGLEMPKAYLSSTNSLRFEALPDLRTEGIIANDSKDDLFGFTQSVRRPFCKPCEVDQKRSFDFVLVGYACPKRDLRAYRLYEKPSHDQTGNMFCWF